MLNQVNLALAFLSRHEGHIDADLRFLKN